MNSLCSLLFRALVQVSCATICVYITYAKEGPALVPIARNLAWNDFITQIKFLPLDSPQDSIDKEMLVIQRFLKEHETETNVGVYDLAVLRAIDHVRSRLHKADKDLETLRNELSYKEEQARLGRQAVRFAAIVHCSKCQQPIVSAEGFGFVYFKIPGKEGYHLFHCRVRAGHCWEAYLKGGRPA